MEMQFRSTRDLFGNRTFSASELADSVFYTMVRVEKGPSLVEDVKRVLGIPDWEEFVPDGALENKISCAREWISLHEPGLESFIDHWGQKVIWIAPPGNNLSNTLSSVSLPECPLHVFLTKMAFFHLPPSGTNSCQEYCFCENLLHESLHLFLGANMDADRLYYSKAEAYETFLVPSWRESLWSFDQCIHGYFVYKTVGFLRYKYALPKILHATAQECASELERTILQWSSNHFTDYGRSWIDWFMRFSGEEIYNILVLIEKTPVP